MRPAGYGSHNSIVIFRRLRRSPLNFRFERAAFLVLRIFIRGRQGMLPGKTIGNLKIDFSL
jgi:hypothetical protein